MKMKEALDDRLLRLVPLSDKEWVTKYKGEKVEKYKDHMKDQMALVNEKGLFWFARNQKELEKLTYTSPAGASVIHVGSEDHGLKIKKGGFIKIQVTEDFLDSYIAEYSEIKQDFSTFINLVFKFINHEELNDIEKVSLIADPRTYKIVATEELLKLVGGGNLGEIVEQKTDRARLYMFERKEGVKKPEALKLFNEPLLNKVVDLK